MVMPKGIDVLKRVGGLPNDMLVASTRFSYSPITFSEVVTPSRSFLSRDEISLSNHESFVLSP